MAWLPISNTVLQYVDVNGDPYSGAVLKFYEAGTSTNIPVATSQTGTPTVTSVALNSAGFPEVSGNVVILFIDQDYKVALYPNQAAADSDTGAIWNPDNIDPFAVLTLPTNLTDINALSPADGTIIVGDGSEWVAETGNTARTSLGLGTGDSPQFTGVTLSGLTTGHVVLANSAGALTALDVTDKGSIIVGDGAGAPSTLAVGANDYVLTADSAEATGIKWAVVPANTGWRLLSTVSASAASTVDVETGFGATYDNYVVVGSGITLSGSDIVSARLKIGGAYDAGSNYFSGTDGATDASADTKMLVTSAGGTQAWVLFYLFDVNSATTKKGLSHAASYATAPSIRGNTYYQLNSGTGAVTGLRFLCDAASTITGTFYLYGMVK